MSKFHRGSGFRLLTSADVLALYEWVRDYVTGAVGALPPTGGNGIYDGSGSVPEGTVASTEDGTATTGLYIGNAIATDVDNNITTTKTGVVAAQFSYDDSFPIHNHILTSTDGIELVVKDVTLESSRIDMGTGAVVVSSKAVDESGESRITLNTSGVEIEASADEFDGDYMKISLSPTSFSVADEAEVTGFTLTNVGGLSFKLGAGQGLNIDVNNRQFGISKNGDTGHVMFSTSTLAVEYEDTSLVISSVRAIPNVAYIQSLTGRFADSAEALLGGVVVGEVWYNTTTSKYMVRLS